MPRENEDNAAIDVAITPAAVSWIRKQAEDLMRRTEAETVVPAIVWLSQELNPHVSFRSRPTLAFYTNEDEIKDDIVEIGGLHLVLAVSGTDLARHFKGREIDVVDGSLVVR